MKYTELNIIIEYYKKSANMHDILFALRKLSINGHKIIYVDYDFSNLENTEVPHFGWSGECSDGKCKHGYDKSRVVVREFGIKLVVEDDYDFVNAEYINFILNDNTVVKI